jgi:hypothetical protein
VLVPGATWTGARIHWWNTKPQHCRLTAANVRSLTQTYCIKNKPKRLSTYIDYLITQTKKWMQSTEPSFSSWHEFNWKETECFWEGIVNKARRHKSNCSWNLLQFLKIKFTFFSPLWRFDPIRGHRLPLRGFAITLIGQTTFGRTPLDELTARRGDNTQHTIHTRDRHPCPWRDSNPHS